MSLNSTRFSVMTRVAESPPLLPFKRDTGDDVDDDNDDDVAAKAMGVLIIELTGDMSMDSLDLF